MKWYEKYAEKHGYKINNDLADIINEGLERNKKEFGARYCPCQMIQNKDTICPCKEFRETGYCHCILFIKESD